jgi:hypothetical protein
VAVNLELGGSNALFIRGQGAGLSWDFGQRLTSLDFKTWVWCAKARSEKIEFQFLLNDEVWEKGETHLLKAGDSIELTPDFEWPEIPRVCSTEVNVRHAVSSS